MGCNCGGQNNTPKEFIYKSADGKQTVYRTEVEARAAQIREIRATGKGGTYAPK